MYDMKAGRLKQILIIIAVIVLVVLNLFTAYEYNKLLQRVNVNDFAGTYQFQRSDQYLSIMNAEDENAFYVYDKYSKCTAAGTYEKVEENCVSLNVEGHRFAALIYSNDKFYYMEEGQDIVVVDRIADSPLYYDQD